MRRSMTVYHNSKTPIQSFAVPIVSILTASHQCGRYIGTMIDSVMAQSQSDWELIIVDDGSTDGTNEVVAPYLLDRRVQFVYQSNMGQAIARNRAYSLSTGAYIAVLDADDYWAPDKLKLQVELMERDPGLGLIYTGGTVVDEQGAASPIPYQARDICVRPLERLLFEMNPVIFSSVLIRRKFVGPGSFEDERIRCSDDVLPLLRVAARSGRFGYIPERLTFYRVHSSSRTFVEGVDCYREGRKRTVDIFFSEENVPRAILKHKRRAYALAYYASAVRYNKFRVSAWKAFANLGLAMVNDPRMTPKLIRQAVRAAYLFSMPRGVQARIDSFRRKTNVNPDEKVVAAGFPPANGRR